MITALGVLALGAALVVAVTALAGALRRRRGLASPERTWTTLIGFWQARRLDLVAACLTPESRAFLEFVTVPGAQAPGLPEELLDYLTRKDDPTARLFRTERAELLETMRSNVQKFWLMARPRGAADSASPPQLSTESLLRHMLSGLPASPGSESPRQARVLETFDAGPHTYVRVLYQPIFAGFGLFDTFKRSGPLWRLDLAAPLLEAAHAARIHYSPGQFVGVPLP